MEPIFESKLRTLDAKADVTAMLVSGRLIPSLGSFFQSQITTQFNNSGEQWSSILNQYLLVSKDLEELWTVDDTSFALTSLAPSRNSIDPNDLTKRDSVKQVLSSMIDINDKAFVRIGHEPSPPPVETSTSSTATGKRSLESVTTTTTSTTAEDIRQHNSSIKEILSSFKESIEQSNRLKKQKLRRGTDRDRDRERNK